MKNQSSFVKAGAVLALSGVVVKLLSAAYRIPLTRMLGADAMGRYSAVYSLFMPFFSFATAGITTSVAHCTAQKGQSSAAGAARLYIPLSLLLGTAFVVFSRFYSVYQQDSFFFYGSVLLAPAIVLSAAENILKGESQGRKNMLPTAVANLLEGVFKTIAGLGGVWAVKVYCHTAKEDTTLAVCFLAVTVSGFLCTAFLLSVRKKSKMETAVSAHKVSTQSLFAMSLPIALSAVTVSASGFFDTAVCLPRIDSIPYSEIVRSFDGASFMGADNMSMYLFGIWQGMVLTVFNLVPSVVSTVSTAALPFVSGSWTEKDTTAVNRHTKRLFDVTAMLCVPAMVFIFCFGNDIIRLLFATTENQTKVAASLLRILCTGGVLCCFNGAFNTVLFAAGKSGKVFYILLSGCVVKAVSGYILCGIFAVNIKAFAVSAVCFYTIIFMRSILEIKKLGINFNCFRIFAAPSLASAVAIFWTLWLEKAVLCSFSLFLKLFFCGLFFVLLYLLTIISTGFYIDK